jgi:hypothetical protein
MKRIWLKILLVTVAAAVALGVLWYLASPWWTLWRVREAARSGDWARLEPYVDLPAITERTRTEMRADWQDLLRLAERRAGHDREFIALARRVLADVESESFAPLDFRPWLANMELRPVALRPKRFRLYILRYGLDRFEVREEAAGWETGPMLTFQRQGMGWQLVGVRWGQQ